MPAFHRPVFSPRRVVVTKRTEVTPIGEIEIWVRRGPKWFRRYATWALRWLFHALCAAPFRKVEEPEWFDLSYDAERIVQNVLINRDDADMLYEAQCGTCYAGPREFTALGEEHYRQIGPVTVPVQCNLSGYQGRRTFAMDVILIPWMQGVLLVPGVVQEKSDVRHPSRF